MAVNFKLSYFDMHNFLADRFPLFPEPENVGECVLLPECNTSINTNPVSLVFLPLKENYTFRVLPCEIKQKFIPPISIIESYWAEDYIESYILPKDPIPYEYDDFDCTLGSPLHPCSPLNFDNTICLKGKAFSGDILI